MALSLKYVGARPYCELDINGVIYGFSRGLKRDDVPDEFIQRMIEPTIANGGSMWVVTNSDDQAQAMLEAVEEPEAAPEAAPEPEPKPEPEPEPKPEPASEQAQAMLDAVETVQFSESMSRPQMMNWCRENGIGTTTSDTKVSLTEKALTYLDPPYSGDAGE